MRPKIIDRTAPIPSKQRNKRPNKATSHQVSRGTSSMSLYKNPPQLSRTDSEGPELMGGFFPVIRNGGRS